MLKNLIVLVALSLVFPAFARADVDCTASSLANEKLHPMTAEGYWMQPVDDCRITHTGVGGVGGTLYNYCTGNYEPFTDGLDPFPIPGGDGNLYIHPEQPMRRGEKGGMGFFKFNEARDSKGQNRSFFKDEELPGVYQSVGLVSEEGDTRRIRIAVGWRAGVYRDYKVTQKDGDYTITPYAKEREVCKNIPTGGLDRELPILSRNGRMIAGRDRKSRVTQVYRIDPDTGNCAQLAKLPSETSKVSFSFDNTRLAFKAVDPKTRKGRLMEMDIKSGALKTLSGPDEDVRYMTYRPDGKLLYTRAAPKTTNLYDRKSELIIMNPESVPQAGDGDVKEIETIGQLWAKACNTPLDLDMLRTVGSRLNSKNCGELVNEKTLANLTAEERLSSKSAAEISQVCVNQSGNKSKKGSGTVR